MRHIVSICILTLICLQANAQTTITLDSTILQERVIAVGVNVPWEILWGQDDHIWFTEKIGTVKRIDPLTGFVTEVLSLTNDVESDAEPGLLGMVLHPDFENNPKVYLVYNYVQGAFDLGERLVSYTWNGTELIDPVTLIDDIPAAGIHNGSRLLFSKDGKLLMTTGDVGSGNLSQDMTSLNGKLLRINPDGSVPTDNPDPTSYIYSYGHRNSQGLTYGPNDILYSSEHGAQSSDEFNIIEAGRNYGWPNVQGECNTTTEINFCNANNVREPLAEWSPCVAVNDLTYYNHDGIPEWKGKMLMAVLGGFVKQPRISVLSLSEDGLTMEGEEEFFDNYGRIRDICVNPHTGAIYFATNGDFYPSSGPNTIVEYFPQVISSSEDIPEDKSLIKVYPNPARQNTSITLTADASMVNASYEVINYNGKVWANGSVNKSTTISTQGLPVGNYYIKVSNAQGVTTKKLIIQ